MLKCGKSPWQEEEQRFLRCCFWSRLELKNRETELAHKRPYWLEFGQRPNKFAGLVCEWFNLKPGTSHVEKRRKGRTRSRAQVEQRGWQEARNDEKQRADRLDFTLQSAQEDLILLRQVLP